MSIITLTTDFGLNDWFVGTMKGVILRIHPHAAIVDLTHGIPSGDIRAGAFALAAGYRYFPRGTIHVAVVDPGVGGPRAGIVVQTAEYFFVGPDNGVLSLALRREKVKTIRRLENARCFLQPVSNTFHGRDLFAPVAAHLSRGLRCPRLGPVFKDHVRLSWPQCAVPPGALRGEVICLDRFGNAITNIENEHVSPADAVGMFVRGQAFVPVKSFYQAVPKGKPVAVPGSSGFLEIAVNGGNAARRLKLKIGTAVLVKRRRG